MLIDVDFFHGKNNAYILDIFAKNNQCMYHGPIICKNCKEYSDCDMAAGREIHEFHFMCGFIHGMEFEKSEGNK